MPKYSVERRDQFKEEEYKIFVRIVASHTIWISKYFLIEMMEKIQEVVPQIRSKAEDAKYECHYKKF